MVNRVGIYIDYQNVFSRGRYAFGDESSTSQMGQIHPLLFAQMLVAKRKGGGVLEFVRVYRGEPNSSRDARGSSACLRQAEVWRQSPLVTVYLRPLRYPPIHSKEKPVEKGIDVQLALDLVLGGLDGAYDTAIVASQDSDLRPAIEATLARTKCHVEVAAWAAKGTQPSRITLPTRNLWCHQMTSEDFKAVSDITDYTL